MQNSIESLVNEIDAIENDIREHINTTRYQNNLIKDGDNWNQICCSLDTIDDTNCAIISYVTTSYPSDTGLKYLFTYGLLQALFIQQDALSHLTSAFGIEYKKSDRIREIRELRNAAIGHPTKQTLNTPGGHVHYNYISRITLDKSGFTLMRSYEQEKNSFIEVEFIPLINAQLLEVKNTYRKLANTLIEADRMHKEKFKDNSLVEIFHSGMRYSFEKIAEAIYAPNERNNSFGLSMLKAVIDVYSTFEAELKSRGDISSYTQNDLDEYSHALSTLRAYLEDEETHLSEKDAAIYYHYIQTQNDHFVKLAKEIDATYISNKPENPI